MHPDEYKKMFQFEDFYWWYRGAHRILINYFEKYVAGNTDLNVLDVGCGTGKNLDLLDSHGNIVGVDISAEAIKYAKLRKAQRRLLQADALFLPFSNSAFDCLVAFDVLYTLENDVNALMEFNRVLKNGALLIMNVPSYNWLRGRHDTAVSTRQRYCRKSLAKKLFESGFKIEKITYWNTFLFPLEAFVRIVTSFIMKENYKSDLYDLPGPINSLLTKIIFLEAYLVKRINFPFGLSLAVVARKG